MNIFFEMITFSCASLEIQNSSKFPIQLTNQKKAIFLLKTARKMTKNAEQTNHGKSEVMSWQVIANSLNKRVTIFNKVFKEWQQNSVVISVVLCKKTQIESLRQMEKRIYNSTSLKKSLKVVAEGQPKKLKTVDSKWNQKCLNVMYLVWWKVHPDTEFKLTRYYAKNPSLNKQGGVRINPFTFYSGQSQKRRKWSNFLQNKQRMQTLTLGRSALTH